jgi:hypothetical protein
MMEQTLPDLSNFTPAEIPFYLNYTKQKLLGTEPPGFCVPYIEDLEDPEKFVLRLVFLILCTLSITGLIFIASMILYNKKLQAHP